MKKGLRGIIRNKVKKEKKIEGGEGLLRRRFVRGGARFLAELGSWEHPKAQTSIRVLCPFQFWLCSTSRSIAAGRSIRKAQLTPQFLRRLTSRHGAVALTRQGLLVDDASPVFPVARHLRQDITHDLGAGHEAVLLAFQDTDFAFTHQAAEPADVVGRDARVFGAVVDDNGAVDVLVAEADGLLGLETDD